MPFISDESYLGRILCKMRLIFPRLNGPNDVRLLTSFQKFPENPVRSG